MIILTILTIIAGLAMLAMAANPPTIKGVTTIVWGTSGQLGSPAGAIVESIAITTKNANGIGEIENGDGAGVVDVLLDDGFEAKVTCVYDTAKSWPATGSAVTLTMPTPYGTGGTTPYTCYVTGVPEVNTSRKKEATIMIPLKFRPGISAT